MKKFHYFCNLFISSNLHFIMAKVLGLGNALVDIMTRLENDELLGKFELPKGSMQLVDITFSEMVLENTIHLSKQQTSGGSAANTIHGLARLGVESAFIGKVGEDELGTFFYDDMLEAKIHPFLLKGHDQTGRAIALVSQDSERTFATYLGAAIELNKNDLKEKYFKNVDYLHIEGYLVQNHELIENAVKMAKNLGLKVSLDLASYNVVEDNLGFLKRIVKDYVDIVFANEEEAKSFTGMDPQKALVHLSEITEIAVVKVGKDGSYIKKDDEIYKVDSIDAEPIDTTGAGDLYAAGFLYGLVHGHSLDKCGKYGSILSGKVIEGMGAKIIESKWTEIKQMIESV